MVTPPPLPDLVDPREDKYFVALLLISILGWGLVVLTCVGLPYVLLIGFFLWLANGLLVARLRSEGVEITTEQEPALHQALGEVCGRLGLATIPRLYVVQAGGALNAFTTRHSSRNFIVLYSDMLEACGSDSAEVRFVLGHEIGHIRRNHVLKSLFLLPGRIMPLIGDAYSRACERTCDRHGAAAAGESDGAVRAMMMLSAGQQYGRTMNAEKFADQHLSERGFFVSWHELTSAYPTLSQRVAGLLALKTGVSVERAPRHPLAYLFALFTLSGPGGGISSLILTIFVVCFLAALAVPAIEGAVKAGQEARAEQTQRQENVRILAQGAMDSRFVGAWAGKDAESRWITTRNAAGDYKTEYEMGSGPDLSKWTQTGQWRVLDGVYHEISQDGENRAYPVQKIEPDKIIFGESDAPEDETFFETRQP